MLFAKRSNILITVGLRLSTYGSDLVESEQLYQSIVGGFAYVKFT